ncbi:SRPBCC family protein [Mycobacterium sp. Marseille-P9652]|uniref:SRPBCC family protein n=1 Tax=Mycobacterium sp. Marseille-P9652 TaxID=2654950 RepID=UPI0018D026B7|nr:SRPBCC family protein [Mycobacterium sp. Marseille-P9652]
MTTIGHFSFHVEASAHRAFDVIADLQGLPQWDGPVARIDSVDDPEASYERRTYRVLMRPVVARIALHMTVAAYDPPRLLKLAVNGRFMHSTDTWRVTSHGHGTHVALTTEHTLIGIFRIFAPLFALAKPVQRRALKQLKAIIEDTPQPQPLAFGDDRAAGPTSPV